MKHKCLVLFSVVCFLLICLCGCGNSDTDTDSDPGTEEAISYRPGVTNVLIPEAPGKVTLSGDFLTLDFSAADQGYFTAFLKEPRKVCIQLTGPDGIDYNYFIEKPNTLTTFPFTAGSGNYLVLTFENIGADQYISLFCTSLTVELENNFLPFLYPNQYVNFKDGDEAIALAAELSKDQATDLEALQTIYEYVISHITYDDEKAATVSTGYLPVIDETLRTGKGICFDYAALMSAMLRALSIPTRLSIGYSGDVRHAWIDVYIQSIGWVKNAVQFTGNQWEMMDPTFAAALPQGENIGDYIGDGQSYVAQYVR